MKMLIDTSVIIDYLRSRNKNKTLFHSLFVNKEHIGVITLITVAELYADKSLSTEKTKRVVDELIDACQIVDDTVEIYRKAGEIIRRNYCHTVQDAIIAAAAIVLRLRLVTLNTKDFKNINEILLYKT